MLESSLLGEAISFNLTILLLFSGSSVSPFNWLQNTWTYRQLIRPKWCFKVVSETLQTILAFMNNGLEFYCGLEELFCAIGLSFSKLVNSTCRLCQEDKANFLRLLVAIALRLSSPCPLLAESGPSISWILGCLNGRFREKRTFAMHNQVLHK